MARAASAVDVRFGSKADMCSAKRHVRFVPIADKVQRKKSGLLDQLVCDA